MTTALTLLANTAHKIVIPAFWWAAEGEEETALERATYDALGVWLPSLGNLVIESARAGEIYLLADAIKVIPGIWAEVTPDGEANGFALVTPDDEELPNGKRWGSDRPSVRLFMGERGWLIAEGPCVDRRVSSPIALWNLIMGEVVAWARKWEELCEEAEDDCADEEEV